MSVEIITATASVGTLVVILATAVAAFIQLRHLENSNRLAVLNDFRVEYEHVSAAANAAFPGVLARLEDRAARDELLSPQFPPWCAPVAPLMRLFETLGAYTNRDLVSRELVCDLWAPVVLDSWREAAPMIAVMRRTAGPSLFENWEAIAVMSERWLSENHASYPKRLPRSALRDPWASEDAAADRASLVDA